MADPSTVTGLVSWYRASDLGLADGTAVGSWSDASGGGFTATQATSTAKPTYKTNILNSEPIVRFDGASDFMSSSAVTGQTTQTVFAVFIPTGSGIRTIRGGDGTGALQFRLDASQHIQLVSQEVLDIGTSTGTTANGTAVVATGVFSDTANTWSIYLNGTASGSGSTTVTLTSTRVTRIGYNAVSTNEFFNGDIAEIISYNRVLTTGERATVHSYIQDTYGITVSDYVSSGQSGSLVATAAASATVAPLITHPSTVAATAAASVVNAGGLTISKVEAATAAASAVIAPVVSRVNALSATAVASPSVRQGPTATVTATAAASDTVAALVTHLPALTATSSASVSISAVRTQPATVISTATASVVDVGALAKSAVATALASAGILPQRTLRMTSNALIDTSATGTFSPLPRRISTVQVETDLTGDPHSITGMQANATVDLSAPSTISLGPPARFFVDVDVTGKFSVITSLIETISVEVGATGNLRVVQSLTTILEEGVPALLTSPDPDEPYESEQEAAFYGQPEPEPVPVPVYNRVFFGIRR